MRTPKPAKLPEISEAAWQKTVVQALAQCGWEYYHPRLSIYSKRGFPDLTCWRAGDRLLFIELKKQSGILRPEQQAIHDSLRAAGQEVYVVRPSDWNLLTTILKRRGK